MPISVNDFRTGVTVEWEGDVWTVVEFMHVKPGKGAAFVRAKLKNVRSGVTRETTFRAGEKLEEARVEKREMQYLYASDGQYTFMDNETYEQLTLTEDQLGEARNFLLENATAYLTMYQGKPIGVELENTVILTVVETDPGVRGDTAQGGSKPAKLETGYVVQVPLFINVGDKLKIDTRTGAYISRA